MDQSTLKHFLTRKSIIIGIGVIILASVLFLVLTTNQQQTENKPQPTLIPTAVTPQKGIDKPIPPDKQIEGQIVVKFRTEMTKEQINQILQKYNASIIKEIKGINYTVLRVPKGQENQIIASMKAEGVVEEAQADFTSHVMYVPNDPSFNQQWGLNNTGQKIEDLQGAAGVDVRAVTAWDTTRGNGIKVAVLDTGINLSHPDLASKIVAQKSFTTPTVEDVSGHGTHVAGIVAAVTNNGVGVAGTCPDCQLVVGKVMDDDGTGATSDIVDGIVWAADQNAKVISLSLGTMAQSQLAIYQSGIDYAVGKGAVVVASAGNCGGTNFAANGCTARNQMSYPGGANNVITVASSNANEQKSSFSNYGAHVEVTAPGSNIYSTLPNHANNKDVLNYGFLSGTSMSTPMTSGVVALIWASQFGTSNTAVINRLYETVDKVEGTGTYWTKGRVNAAKAVGPPVVPTVAPTLALTPTFVCAGSASGNVCPPTPTNPPPPIGGPTTIVATTAPTLGAGTTPSTTNSPSASVSPTLADGVTPIVGGSNPLDPCANGMSNSSRSYQNNNSQRDHKMHIESRENSGGRGFMRAFFEFFFRLIMLFLQLLGGGGSICGTPSPTLFPTANPSLVPSTNPTTVVPSSIVQPTPSSGVNPPATTPGASGTTVNIKITFYGSFDNDPAGSKEIANPVMHQEAGGTGTYADPLTFASPAGAGEYPFGKIIYVPRVQKYFVREDECAVSWTAPDGCGAVTMVDLYVGNPSDAEAVLACEESLTPDGDTQVILDPPSTLPVDATPIWNQATGTCMTPHT